MTCTGCGFEPSPDFAFCPCCGQRLSAAGEANTASVAAPPRPPPPPAASPAREADRRQVTVLFADQTGFTALSERLDPEVVRAFQTALFDTPVQAIARCDGFVEKFVGDAVMAVFGAPALDIPSSWAGPTHDDGPLTSTPIARILS